MDNNLVLAVFAVILILAVLPMFLLNGQFKRKGGDSTSSSVLDGDRRDGPDGGAGGGDGGGGGE